MEKVLNLTFSIKALRLKVMTLFHFRLNTLYFFVCVTMLSPTVHSGLAGYEKGFKFGVLCKSALGKSYDAFHLPKLLG